MKSISLRCLTSATVGIALWAVAHSALAQFSSTSIDGYGLKVFRVESGAYPFVQVYFRTFDQEMAPLDNLNELNIGVMVKGRPYDATKKQYMIQSIANRDEIIRSVLVIDTSKTMAGGPFERVLEAAARFIDSKRMRDQVAVVATVDDGPGYEIVSNFERDMSALGRRLADLSANGQTTRLYDSVAAAMQLCGTASQGDVSTGLSDYVASCSIVLMSDGKDEGSALTRSDLMNRITNLELPIPIYSLAYSKVEPVHLKNLEALSKNTFGKYFPVGESSANMTRAVENIQHILQNDYVVTLRAYLDVDGGTHPLKIGVEYPSRSGRMRYESAEFEAIQPPPLEPLIDRMRRLDKVLPALSDRSPYLPNPFPQSAGTTTESDN